LRPIDISIVVPLYNEEAVFDTLIQRLTKVMDQAKFSCEVLLINDGSIDKTDQLIEKICENDNRFMGVLLSRNHGIS
jgi:glycosyltransferase involved in cell wall biosynthesis